MNKSRGETLKESREDSLMESFGEPQEKFLKEPREKSLKKKTKKKSEKYHSLTSYRNTWMSAEIIPGSNTLRKPRKKISEGIPGEKSESMLEEFPNKSQE